MEEKTEIKEIKISNFRMVMKFVKLFLFTLFRTKWYIPGVSEITVEELNNLIKSNKPPIIVDTRDRVEFYGTEGPWKKYGHIQNSKSIPIFHLTANLKSLAPFKDEVIVTICPGGGMSLIAAEIMAKAGFTDVRSLKKGIDDWDRKGYPTTTERDPNYPLDEYKPTFLQVKEKPAKDKKSKEDSVSIKVHRTLDARNLSCPVPIMKSKKELTKLKTGQVLEILTTDPGSKRDIPAWAQVTGQELISSEEIDSSEFRFLVKKLN